MNTKYIATYISFLILCLEFTANGSLLNEQTNQLKFTHEGKIELIHKSFISIKELQNNKEQIPQVFNANHLDSLINTYAKGGDISGSGNTLFYNGKRKLLDVFFINSPASSLPLAPRTSSNLIENFNPSETNIDTTILPIFKRLSNLYPSLSTALFKIYKHIPFYLVSGQFRFLDSNFHLDKKLEYPIDAELSTTALYIKNIGVLVSRNQFYEMDEFNQTALIIHELLRSLQLQYSLQMKNSEIQSITEALMNPSIDLTNVLMSTSLQPLLKPQEGSIVKGFRILLDTVMSKYNIVPSINPNSSNLNSFDLANISADVSLQLLNLRIKLKSEYVKKDELQKIEIFEDEFDKKVAEFRSNGVRSIYYNSLEGLIGSNFLFNAKPVQAFILMCNREWIESQECTDLSHKLRALIY